MAVDVAHDSSSYPLLAKNSGAAYEQARLSTDMTSGFGNLELTAEYASITNRVFFW